MAKQNNYFNYSFSVDKDKLKILKEALTGENTDISKFLRSCIDKKVKAYQITINCLITSSSGDDSCENCNSFKECPQSPFVKKMELKRTLLEQAEIDTMFGGK